METLLERNTQGTRIETQTAPEINPWKQAGRLYLFVWLSLVYWEVLLIPWNRIPVTPTSALYVALFSAAGAAVYALLSTLSRKEKTNYIVLLVLMGLTALFFAVEHFCRIFFTNFMSVESMFTGAKGVISDFIGVVIGLVAARFWMVALMLVPIGLLIFLRKKEILSLERFPGSARIAAASAALLLFAFARLLVYLNPSAQDRYTVHYEYNTAISSFGLRTATRLDLEYLVFGGYSSDFEIQSPDQQPEEPSDDPGTGPAEPVEPTPQDPEDPDTPTGPDSVVPVDFGSNALDIDFEALAEAAEDEDVAALHRYVASLEPSRKNEYTGLFAGKNLIFLSAESFSKEAIDPVYTPTLYRMLTHGIHINEYYQPTWGGSTTTGEYSNLTGLIPMHGAGSMQATIGKDMHWTLGNQLMRQGYFSRAYHPHNYTFYDRHLTHENMGYEKFIGYGNGLEDRITNQWPESDLEMMEATVDEYIDHQPFSIYYMTVSGHAIYTWEGNSISAKNRELVEDMDASQTIQGYMAANIELDRGLAYLIGRLEDAGIADDTVIVLGTDHYPYALESESSPGWDSALDELYGFHAETVWDRDHSALLIWSGCLENRSPIVVDTPVYSLDIVPTISNLMGLPYDSRLLVGRDIFSDTIPLAIWPDHSWVTDKATYNGVTGEYEVREGFEGQVDDEYLSNVRRLVTNKFTFSNNVLDVDYYHILAEASE